MKPIVPSKLPIADVKWEPLIPFIGRANRALAHYEGVLCGVPNAELLLSPLTTQEAILSARIEGTQTTLGEVLKFEAGDKPSEMDKQIDIQEILNYRRSLLEAEKHITTRPFTLNLLRKLHETLLDSVRGRDKGRGEFRTTQNWIGKHGTPIEKADFVPPSPIVILSFLDNWEKYYHSDRPDPLVQLSIVHAQFEVLHPFLDGNGRIGRILIPLYLYEKKLLSRPTFYLSEWLDEHRDDYIENLRNLDRRDGSWNRWIEFFLTGIEQQSQRNAAKARKIMELYDQMKKTVIQLTRSSFAVPLLDQLFQRPVFRTSDLQCQPAPTRAAVASLIRALHKAAIIKTVRRGSGRRGAIFALRDLINICEGKQVI
jgi:Fic family protein